jgi:hypothetical protein
MKYFLFISLLLFVSACATTTYLSYTNINSADFDKIKNSTWDVYVLGESIESNNLQWTDNKTWESERIISEFIFQANKKLPNVIVQKGIKELPPAFRGELSLNTKKQINNFIREHSSDYLVTLSSISLHSESHGSLQSYTAKAEIALTIDIYDTKTQKLVLSFAIERKGSILFSATLLKAIEFIKKEGIVD